MPEAMPSNISQLDGSYVIEPVTLAEKLLTDPYHGGIMTIPYSDAFNFQKSNNENITTKSIPFHMGSNFNFSLNNNWSTMVPEDITSTFDSISNLFNFATNENNQISWQSQLMQTAVWKSSETPKFKIDTTFVSTSRCLNPVNIIIALAAGALPGMDTDIGKQMAESDITKKTVSGVAEGIGKVTGKDPKQISSSLTEAIKKIGLVAPFGYNPSWDDGGSLKNKCSLSIGKWFYATDLIIDGISNIEFSKEVVAPRTNFGRSHSTYMQSALNTGKGDSGYPLYAKCSITFKPYRPITSHEFSQYFLSGSTSMSRGVLDRAVTKLTE